MISADIPTYTCFSVISLNFFFLLFPLSRFLFHYAGCHPAIKNLLCQFCHFCQFPYFFESFWVILDLIHPQTDNTDNTDMLFFLAMGLWDYGTLIVSKSQNLSAFFSFVSCSEYELRFIPSSYLFVPSLEQRPSTYLQFVSDKLKIP